MPARVRKPLSFVASLVGHLVVLGGFANGWALRCSSDIEIPEIELELTEVELIDPEMLQGEEAAPVPEPPPPAEPPPKPPEEPKPEIKEDAPKPPEEPKPEPPPEEKPKFAAKGSEADKLAPPQSTFHMLLVPKKIRKLPFSQQVLDIMAPLPDFELLIDKGRFDALRDFDHIVIASPNIQDWTQTFLAVDYRISREEVQRAIERAAAADGNVIEWIEDGGPLRGNPRPKDPEADDPDNRWFVFLEGKVAIYVREEFLPSILAGPAGDDRKTAGNFVANLAKLRRFADRQPEAGMQLVFKGIRRSLKKGIKVGGKPLPFKIPDELEISASAAEEPELVIRFEFETAADAKTFGEWWESEVLLDALDFGTKLVAGPIYRQLAVERDGVRVALRGQLTTDQTVMLMGAIAKGSAQIARKSPAEIAEMRQRRIDALKARRGGKLPPSALDPKAPKAPGTTPGGETKADDGKAPSEAPSDPPPIHADPDAPEPSPAPPEPAPTPAEPAKTPAGAPVDEAAGA